MHIKSNKITWTIVHEQLNCVDLLCSVCGFDLLTNAVIYIPNTT